MFNNIRIRWSQYLEEAREKSFREASLKALGKYLTVNRIVVPVFNDLEKVKGAAKAEPDCALELLVVSRDNAHKAADLYRTPSRRLKIFSNTRAGYYAYAVLSGGEVVGDIWCATPACVGRVPIHPDLYWLAIECKGSEAYMFDMYVAPDSRGKVVTSFLLGNALSDLKERGYQKVYGFYEKGNLPALWTHRLFGYTELANRKVSRFLFLYKSEPVTTGESAR